MYKLTAILWVCVVWQHQYQYQFPSMVELTQIYSLNSHNDQVYTQIDVGIGGRCLTGAVVLQAHERGTIPILFKCRGGTKHEKSTRNTTMVVRWHDRTFTYRHHFDFFMWLMPRHTSSLWNVSVQRPIPVLL